MEKWDSARLDELKKIIEGHLRSTNVFGELRQILSEQLTQQAAEAAVSGSGASSSSNRLMDIVQERGIVQSLLQSLLVSDPCRHTLPTNAASPAVVFPVAALKMPTKVNHRYLHVKLLGGRAFLDHLDTDPTVLPPGDVLSGNGGGKGSPLAVTHSEVFVCLQFGTQRWQSLGAPCVCDPPWDDDCLLDLDQEKLAAGPAFTLPLQQPPNRDLLRLAIPLEVVVMKRDRAGKQQRHYVGENAIEWRRVLKAGSLAVSVELGGGTGGLKVPLGVLELQIDLIPAPTSRTAVPEEDIVSQISGEKAHRTAAEREFLVYARRWWEEFHTMNRDHARRIVKVFAQLSGAAPAMLPVTSWVSPLTANRLLDSPQHAARFVSLLGAVGAGAVLGGAGPDDGAVSDGDLIGVQGGQGGTGLGSLGGEGWLSTHTFLLRGRGPVANHCMLLCSLLLGFGLDAYVVLGREEAGPHSWVMTRSFATSPAEITFWESTTGARYPHLPPAPVPVTTTGGPPVSVPHPRHRYTHIGCVFNDGAFYANIQRDDTVAGCVFDLDDETRWKPMSMMKLKLVKPQPKVALLPTVMDLSAMEENLEGTLMRLLQLHRDANGMITAAALDMGYLLTQALVAYEHEKLSGVVADTRFFESAIRGHVRDGYTFKGYPMHFNHLNDRRIFAAFLQSRTCRDIVETTGQVASHCIRVKCFAYPENALSVWVMLAVRFKPGPA